MRNGKPMLDTRFRKREGGKRFGPEIIYSSKKMMRKKARDKRGVVPASHEWVVGEEALASTRANHSQRPGTSICSRANLENPEGGAISRLVRPGGKGKRQGMKFNHRREAPLSDSFLERRGSEEERGPFSDS